MWSWFGTLGVEMTTSLQSKLATLEDDLKNM
jgi:hypothetical protein